MVLWRELADADEHLSKGDRIYIEGRLRTRSWQDADGVQHRATEIVADRMEMLGGARRPDSHQRTQPEDRPHRPLPPRWMGHPSPSEMAWLDNGWIWLAALASLMLLHQRFVSGSEIAFSRWTPPPEVHWRTPR